MTLAHRIACNHGILLELALHEGELWQVTDRHAKMLAFIDGWYLIHTQPITGAWS